MKRIFLLLALVLLVFCLSSAALAEGFTVSGDLTFGTPNDSGSTKDQLGYLTVGGEKDLDPFIIGGSVIIGVYIDPPLVEDQEALSYIYGIYGGYKFLADESFGLAAVAGYYAYRQTFTDPPLDLKWEASSLVAGLKASVVFDPITLSLTYLYGLNPQASLAIGGVGESESAEAGFSLLEFKASYPLNDSWGLEAVYRDFGVVGLDATSGDGTDLGSTVFGAGVTYKF